MTPKGRKVKGVKTTQDDKRARKHLIRSWLKFFTSAGIPLDSAQAYATTFSIHEICMDMLLDLKKEYLSEMGITLFGHIIAILRHAKAFHDTLKKTVGGKQSMSPLSVQFSPKVTTVTPVKHSVGRRDVCMETEIEHPINLPDNTPRPIAHLASNHVAGKKRKGVESETISLDKSPKIPMLKQAKPAVEKKAKLMEVEKKPVFERLGLDSSVSSSTEIDSPRSVSPDSVFLRLGGRSGVTSLIQEKNEMPLQYAGVLKSHSPSPRTVVRQNVGKIVKLKSSMSPSIGNKKMISDMITTSNSGYLNERKVSIKDRLGIDKRPPAQASSRLSVKNRLVSRPQVPDSSTSGSYTTKKVSFGSVSQVLIPKVVKTSPLKSVSHLYSSLPDVPVSSRLGVSSRIPISPSEPVYFQKKRYVNRVL